jgi:hypothetical protein
MTRFELTLELVFSGFVLVLTMHSSRGRLRTHGFYITIVEYPCCVMSDCQHANILVGCWFGGSTDILAQGYVSKRCLLAS